METRWPSPRCQIGTGWDSRDIVAVHEHPFRGYARRMHFAKGKEDNSLSIRQVEYYHLFQLAVRQAYFSKWASVANCGSALMRHIASTLDERSITCR